MSQEEEESTAKVEESNEVQYVYQDEEYQILTEGEESGEQSVADLRELLCTDGSRAILVDGQYYLTDGNQTILYQEGEDDSEQFTQYYFKDHAGYVLDENSTNEETTNYVQLVEEDTNDDSSQQQIYYYADPSSSGSVLAGDDETVNENSEYPEYKKIKLETINLEDFIQQQQQENPEKLVQYAVLQDGTIHQLGHDDEEEEEEEQQIVEEDVSKITGRNLLTGQTVTLDGYMEKLQRKLSRGEELPVPPLVSIRRDRRPPPSRPIEQKKSKEPLISLLDKKIAIGKTRSGKNIIGRIVKVEKKNGPKIPSLQPLSHSTKVQNEEALPLPYSEDDEEEEPENLVINDKRSAAPVDHKPKKPTSSKKFVVRKSAVNKETFEQISKTLGGVMDMESVRKKLEQKNLVVKLVEKKYLHDTKKFQKMTSYSYGYMERATIEEDGREKWKFVLDKDTQEALLKSIEEGKAESGEEILPKMAKYPTTTSLTIIVSQTKIGNKTIKVNLGPALGYACIVCTRDFKTNSQLRLHLKQAHNIVETMMCEVCSVSFDDADQLEKHKKMHVEEGKLFLCADCDKCFTSQVRFNQHMAMHNLYNFKPFECPPCNLTFSCEALYKKHAQSHPDGFAATYNCSLCHKGFVNQHLFKRHMHTHRESKGFSCDICQKQFLSHYDVSFHRKVHFQEKQYVCSVCMRTFSRHSNLIRHMEIHEGTGALYKCEVCSCSYKFVSSLTRHIVQNHIDVGDFRKKVSPPSEPTSTGDDDAGATADEDS